MYNGNMKVSLNIPEKCCAQWWKSSFISWVSCLENCVHTMSSDWEDWAKHIGACANYSKMANSIACLPVHICRPFTLNLWFLKWGPATLGGSWGDSGHSQQNKGIFYFHQLQAIQYVCYWGNSNSYTETSSRGLPPLANISLLRVWW